MYFLYNIQYCVFRVANTNKSSATGSIGKGETWEKFWIPHSVLKKKVRPTKDA